MPEPHIAHWDDVPSSKRGLGEIAAEWRDLGTGAGTVRVGLRRFGIEPGMRPTPAHDHGAEEEIFYVLGGSGVTWVNGQTYEICEGDGIVYLPRSGAHTVVAGPDGLDVLAFGQRLDAELCHLPRAGVMWAGAAWVPDAVAAGHPFKQEWEKGGPLPMPEAPSPRPPFVVALADAPEQVLERPGRSIRRRDIGRAAGSQATGLKHIELAPGSRSYPRHCHSAEEELFVVLAGEGTVVVGDAEAPVRLGSVVARPAGSREAHAFRAGPAGLAMLAYGTREPHDICFYPDSNKLFFRGLGVIGRVEPLDYWDGED